MQIAATVYKDVNTVEPTQGVTHGSQVGSTNTGVPTGTTLTAVGPSATGTGWYVENSTFYVTSAVTIVDLDIPYVVKVLSNGVTMRRCKISAASWYLVNTSDPPVSYSGLTLEDCELYGLDQGSPPTVAVMGTVNATYKRCNIHGMGSSGPRLATGTLLEECWLHDFAHVEPEHEAGTSANDGGTNIAIVRCNIDINSGGASNCIGIYRDFAGSSYDGITVQDNLLNGGAYGMNSGINVPGSPVGTSTINFTCTGNIFGRKYHAECGIYGPVSQWATGSGNVWSNNTWGSGAAATGTHTVGDPVNP